MAKIIQISKTPTLVKPYLCTVLIHGKEYHFSANSISHVIEKILHADKFESRENIETDLKLNFKWVQIG